jgi:hypothetical protein
VREDICRDRHAGTCARIGDAIRLTWRKLGRDGRKGKIVPE